MEAELHHDGAAPGTDADRLIQLVGSRLCHDLANPIGAIANGVELLQMAGAEPGSAEMALVADSVAHATARLRFLRIAFGAAAAGQMLARAEAQAILAGLHDGGRLRVIWGLDGDRPRAEVKLAFLALQCIETVLPRGGEVRVELSAGRWRIAAEAERIKEAPALWALLEGGPLPADLRAAEVQFALAPRAAALIGRTIAAEVGTGTITLDF